MRRWLGALLALLLPVVAHAQTIINGGGGGSSSGGVAPFTFTCPNIGETLVVSGIGCVGVAVAPQGGYGIYMNLPTINLVDGGERIALGSTASATPTSAASAGTAAFGAVINSHLLGSFDNSAQFLNYGIQSYSYIEGTAAALHAYGMESAVIDIATANTTTNADALWLHVDNNSGQTITNARGGFTQITCAGTSCTNTTSWELMNNAGGVTNVALKVDDQTGGSVTNTAILTGAGAINFGDLINAGDGTTRAEGLTINGKSGQSQNLLSLQIGSSQKFGITNGGSPVFTTDINSGNSNTFIAVNSAGVQKFRFGGSTPLGQIASDSGLQWSSTTAASGTADISLSRSAAGVLQLGNVQTAGSQGALKLSALEAGGAAPTLTGTCTTSTQVGGQFAGSFHATCAAQTVIITFATTAPNGWVCNATDETTTADALKQTSHAAASCTLTGTTVAADNIVFSALAY